MPMAPPAEPPPLVWTAQPAGDELARAEATWMTDAFINAIPASGAVGAMTCFVLGDGRLTECRPVSTAQASPAASVALTHLADVYRLDPTSRRSGDRVTVMATFPRPFDEPPRIIARPTAADVVAATPKGASGYVEFTCHVGAQGAVDHCVLKSSPDLGVTDNRLGAAALSLASKFSVRPAHLHGVATEAFERFEVHLGRKVSITNPDWLRKPDFADFSSALPARAANEGKSGAAIVRCRVEATGVLTGCDLIAEGPPDYGFGQAALNLTRLFVMKPRTIDGKSVAGGEVTIPMAWTLGANILTRDPFTILSWVPWAQAPTAADVAAALRQQAKSRSVAGHVNLRCRLTAQGVPRNCRIQLEQPEDQGFAAASLKLSPMFRARLSELPSGATRDDVDLSFDFSAATQTKGGEHYIRTVDWVRGFDPDRAQAVYPEAAVKSGVFSGRAMVDCRISADGTLEDCGVATQDPAGEGFGAAAVTLAKAMRANIWTRDGQPAIGARVRLPIHLIYAADHSEAADAKGPAAPPSH